jgi:hypothetical protein
MRLQHHHGLGLPAHEAQAVGQFREDVGGVVGDLYFPGLCLTFALSRENSNS